MISDFINNSLQMKFNKNFIAQTVLLICMCFLAIESKSQDAQFSQFDKSPLSINPAFAGAFYGDIRLLANYRNQWSVSAPYNTFAFSYDMGLMKRKGKTGYLGARIIISKR